MPLKPIKNSQNLELPPIPIKFPLSMPVPYRQHILYRQKEQFSDGVGYNWIDTLKEHASAQVSDQMMANAHHVFPHNTPTSKEGYYYRSIFEDRFPQVSF